MRFSLSTNWCNRDTDDGEQIAAKALALGFDSLELGFRTTREQVPGIKKMLSQIPVTSVHAFCPVPLSAPSGHPELFQLASFSGEERALARAHVSNTIRFAGEIGATCAVLHAGRVCFSSLFSIIDSARLRDVLTASGKDTAAPAYAKLLAKARKIRAKRGRRLLDPFKKELEILAPLLEKNGVKLAFENLPYLEGFPDESEIEDILGAFSGGPFRAWFDTGHHRVRRSHAWIADDSFPQKTALFAGMHLNDVVDLDDDHFAPGCGKVDFAALEPLAKAVEHVVFEPCSAVSPDALAQGLELIKKLYSHG